jgi:CBS domain-containing protein
MRGPSALSDPPPSWEAGIVDRVEAFSSDVQRQQTVADVMTSRVHVATASAPLKHLLRVIGENRVSAIPIVNQQGIPIGVVAASDLLLKERRDERKASDDPKRSLPTAKFEGIIAADLMTSPAITVALGTSLDEAGRLMNVRNVRRLVVVDERGRVAGIVSRSDLLHVFLRSHEELHEEVHAGAARSKTRTL